MKRIYLIKLKPLIISIIIPLLIGGLSGLLTRSNISVFASLNKPPLTPPAIVFPIVWTILYILMGISAYLIYISDSQYKSDALRAYALQLIVNFFWSIIFFNFNAYLFAFIWLVLLWILIIIMIISFCKIDKTAAYLQIPYLIWVTFAGYLNFSIFLLNR